MIATNGYTPKSLPWHARRVIPFVGYMAATETLPPALLAKQLPHRRTVIDSNLDIDFFRPAPDSPRLLFGGATANGLQDPAAIARSCTDVSGARCRTSPTSSSATSGRGNVPGRST